jgi:hypothetical protein
VIAGQAGPERGEEGLAEDGEHVVDVKVDGGRERVGAEGADDLGEPLLDGHPPGVLADEVCGWWPAGRW